MKPFWALRIHSPGGEGQPYAKLQQMSVDELTPGEVVMEVHYSGINFKDALAGSGKGRILKSFPLNGGIDAAGIVLESQDPKFKKGDQVLVHGAGTGETYDGGFAEVLRAPTQNVLPLPFGFTLRESMILGTAGFTAALALIRMEHNGQRPDLGPILVTGASGGVGSFAVHLFANAGYEVHAVSGKPECVSYLKQLGAAEVIAPNELKLGNRPLEKAIYGGAVDNVGGELLSKILPHIQLWGNVAAIGLAQSADLNTTVMPFILRGVSMLGASSNNTPQHIRQEIWNKLGSEWRIKDLEQFVTRTIGMKDLIDAFDDILHRKVHGRMLVEIRK